MTKPTTALLGLALAAAAAAQTPCHELQFGTRLTMTDDSVSTQVLPFAFPWHGGTVTAITICSNGFVWMNGTSTGTDYTPTEAEFLAGAPRIAPMWCDLNPALAVAPAGVWVNLIPPTTVSPGRAVITWDRVPYYGTSTTMSMQLQLDDSGRITVFHNADSGVYTSATIVGATAGNNAAPNAVDLSAGSHNSGTSPTVYELFNAPGGPVDLFGAGQLWLPNGTAGLVTAANPCPVAAFATYGSGCVKNGTIYESFATNTCDLTNHSVLFLNTGTGYVTLPGAGFDTSFTAQIAGVGDDTTHQNLATGFPFPFAGQTFTTVSLCSNGFLWLGNAASTDYSPTYTELLTLAPRIAGLWRDLTPNLGGAVYWDSNPNYAMATWSAVPTYGTAGSASDVQVKLFANGDIELNYGTVHPAGGTFAGATQSIVGFSEGNGAFDPGTVDLTALPAASTIGTAGAIPLVLRAQAGSRPALGGTFTAELVNIPTGTAITAFVVGLQKLNVDASVYGMPGCTQYASLDATVLALTGGSPMTTFTLGIPSQTAYLGIDLHVQGISLSPGLTPVGAIASNGGTIHIGN